MTIARPADEAERRRAIEERRRNVIVDAGAGTGKTTLLVARLLHLIAPCDDGEAVSLARVAAVTFTRKAAGELKLRMREALLRELSTGTPSELRRARLREAMDGLDNAQISTVHSFADRLLRLRPADARLSPEYAIVDDPSPYVDETFRWLLDAAEQGTLEASLAGTHAAEHAREACETLRLFQSAGLRMRSEDHEFAPKLGLDAFVADVIGSRDRPIMMPARREPDLGAVRRHADELARSVEDLTSTTTGARTLRRLRKAALGLVETGDVGSSLRRTIAWQRDFHRCSKDFIKRDHFPEDAEGWAAWLWLTKGTRGQGKSKQERPRGPLAADVVAPLMGYLAERLVRMRPVILEGYARIKRAHAVLDQIDLLIALRDLLEGNLEARAFYQQRLAHLLVDEFQDTDPLQAEIVLYLCEDGARAKGLAELVLAPGKLTIVGDPKQSIYRFRRADITMYAQVCERLRRADVCEAQLTVNFRSASSILSWVNDAFDALLGKEGEGPRYDPDLGAVRNVRLAASHGDVAGPAVHVLPFRAEALGSDEARDLEGQALALYLRHLVEEGEVSVRDPHDGKRRRPRYGDIAVMMVATQTVHHLTAELDVVGVPHVVRGGTLFMEDPLHRQFVLGLRALSDAADGAARAALMRPPFFAISLEDLVRRRHLGETSPALAGAEAIVGALRRARRHTTPGEIARRVLEETGFGAFVASGRNGAQRLARLYELCLALDAEARERKLDFDGVTALARAWIDAPARIEAPLPVDADAVQVITAHQAKGLEWPIVALWDGRAILRGYLHQVALSIDAVSGRWALKLEGLVPDASHKPLLDHERALRTEERKRVAYVAATRARDLLIVPDAGEGRDPTIAGTLIRGAGVQPHVRVPDYLGDGQPWWRGPRVSTREIEPLADDLVRTFEAAAARASMPRLVPSSVTGMAHAAPVPPITAEEPLALRALREPRSGRHGARFGSTVHRALELLLTKRASDVDAAVRVAAREHELEQLLPDAVEDVVRARASLVRAGLLAHPLRLEYPVAGAVGSVALVSGYIDLVVATPEGLVVIDFKTDAPPRDDARTAYPGYVAQVATYARLLDVENTPARRSVRSALLFTANGALHWT